MEPLAGDALDSDLIDAPAMEEIDPYWGDQETSPPESALADPVEEYVDL